MTNMRYLVTFILFVNFAFVFAIAQQDDNSVNKVTGKTDSPIPHSSQEDNSNQHGAEVDSDQDKTKINQDHDLIDDSEELLHQEGQTTGNGQTDANQITSESVKIPVKTHHMNVEDIEQSEINIPLQEKEEVDVKVSEPNEPEHFLEEENEIQPNTITDPVVTAEDTSEMLDEITETLSRAFERTAQALEETTDPPAKTEEQMPAQIKENLDTDQEQDTETNKPVTSIPTEPKEIPKPTPTPLTPEEEAQMALTKEKEEKYHAAIKSIYSSNNHMSSYMGYDRLKHIANEGHINSEVELAFGHLAGVHLPLAVNTAKAIFEKHAANGNPKAQAGLAFLYATGIGTNSSQAKALVYLTFSALGDDPLGRMMLGYRYWAGIGVAKNCEAALTFYKKGAEEIASKVTLTGGSATTRIRLLDEEENPGSNYGRVDDDLVQYYQFLADKGDAPAQVTLGQLNYQGGRGFEQNRHKAFEYFERAAKMGNANAQGYLGKIYAEGSETVKQNNESAIRYFKLAADQSNPIGHAGLGVMYLYGKGVKMDYNKAFKHFQTSADQGWPEGQLHLGNMYFHGQGVKRNYQQAIHNFNLAAQNGHLLALYYLGKMYATGTGTARNCRTAVELYKNVNERGRWASMLDVAYNQYKQEKINSALSIYLLLAELGYEVAQSNVAYILDQEKATLLNQTYARALVHWDRAASQGYVVARIKLGDYHYYGKGTDVDYEIAASHYKEASDSASNAQAYFNLGYMHEQGLGMQRDIHLAKRQYDLAAEASPDAAAPVKLALLKLGILYAIETIEAQKFWHTVSLARVTSNLPEEWDIYLMTILALMLGFVVAFRRQRR